MQIHIDYKDWAEELKEIAVTKFDFVGNILEEVDWMIYFSRGMSPEEAIVEDMANAE